LKAATFHQPKTSPGDFTRRAEAVLTAWEVKLDRDALKEIWLLFENHDTKFPLYPGQRCWIHYSYRMRRQLMDASTVVAICATAIAGTDRLAVG
jgi:hypothetical protein